MGLRAVNIARRTIQVNAKDPTRTVTLRGRFVAEATRRHVQLGRSIRQTLLNMGIGPVTMAAAPPNRFTYLRNPEKVDEFMKWLEEEQARTTLELVPGVTGDPVPWTNTYIRSSYQKGLLKAQAQLRAKGIDIPSPTFGAEGVLGIFHQPFHQERVALIYTRTFESLKGIDATMAARMRQELSRGLIEGIGPEEMARRMVGPDSPLQKVGIARAKLIARTEVVETFNQAAVGEYTRAEDIIGEEVFVEWLTAEDERVRSSHASRHGKIYTKEEYLNLIGDPNCRCSGAPHIKSVDGEREAA